MKIKRSLQIFQGWLEGRCMLNRYECVELADHKNELELYLPKQKLVKLIQLTLDNECRLRNI